MRNYLKTKQNKTQNPKPMYKNNPHHSLVLITKSGSFPCVCFRCGKSVFLWSLGLILMNLCIFGRPSLELQGRFYTVWVVTAKSN